MESVVFLVALSYTSVLSSSIFSAGSYSLIHDIPVIAKVSDHKVLHQRDIIPTIMKIQKIIPNRSTNGRTELGALSCVELFIAAKNLKESNQIPATELTLRSWYTTNGFQQLEIELLSTHSFIIKLTAVISKIRTATVSALLTEHFSNTITWFVFEAIFLSDGKSLLGLGGLVLRSFRLTIFKKSQNCTIEHIWRHLKKTKLVSLYGCSPLKWALYVISLF